MINAYGAVAGSSFTLQSYGGAGTGAFSETTTSGSTAANCSITGRVLSNTSSPSETTTCVVLLTRAASRNYLIETATATIYFFAFVINQPSPPPGSGPNIALTGENDVTVDLVGAPIITGLSTLTLSLSAGGDFTISGAGFGLTQLTVKFWRNKSILVTSSDGSTLVIPISSIAPLSPTTGKVLVINDNGTAVSIDTLTITP
jgi:hypothetical protein